jgi:ribonuclease T2
MLLRFFLRACVALTLASLVQVSSFAQGTAPATPPGQFDFYVLSLSWSPSYCEATGDKRKDPQCARPFGFVVHGLWPQFEKGYPSDCADQTRLPQSLIKAQLDIFPAGGLVVHEWRKHGSCSGLDAAAYFEAVHKAFAGITIPTTLAHIDKPQFAVPGEIAKAFFAANKGLEAESFAVVCNRQRLEEVRVCLNKDLKTFHPCPQVVSSQCKLDKTYMPAMRAAN